MTGLTHHVVATQARATLLLACLATAAVTACGQSTGESSAARAAHVSAQDRAWVHLAHQADLAEEQAGQLAETNGGSPAVRSAGAMLLRDHTALDASLVKTAGRLGITVPTAMTVAQTELGDRLSKETGQAFDNDFTASMLTAHESMVGATRSEVSHGSSRQVVGLARQALTVMLKHLRMLRAVSAKAG